MDINIVVKIKAGPRSKTEVVAYSTAVNPKEVKFANGRATNCNNIADWIQRQVQEELERFGGEK